MHYISIPPQNGQPPEYILVALHGWGANGQDVAALATLLDLPDVQMIFPDAPFPYAYASTGRVWYNFPDNYTFACTEAFRHQPELVESKQRLTDWLRSLHALTGVPLSRTLLAGFSQGGAMAMDVGLDLPLAGLMVLSGYQHSPPAPQATTFPPVLMVHGTRDPVVPLAAAQAARDRLRQLGVSVSYHELPIGHEIPPVVLDFMQNFTEVIRLPSGETA